jgi:hypothetical protein
MTIKDKQLTRANLLILGVSNKVLQPVNTNLVVCPAVVTD